MKRSKKLAVLALAACLALTPAALSAAESGSAEAVTSATTQTQKGDKKTPRRTQGTQDPSGRGEQTTDGNGKKGRVPGQGRRGKGGRLNKQDGTKTQPAALTDEALKGLTESGVIETCDRITAWLKANPVPAGTELEALHGAGVITDAEYSAIAQALAAGASEAEPAEAT